MMPVMLAALVGMLAAAVVILWLCIAEWLWPAVTPPGRAAGPLAGAAARGAETPGGG